MEMSEITVCRRTGTHMVICIIYIKCHWLFMPHYEPGLMGAVFIFLNFRQMAKPLVPPKKKELMLMLNVTLW